VPELAGRQVRLVPLREEHVEGLVTAAAQDRGTYAWTSVPDGPAAMTAYVAELLAGRDAGEVVPFAQLDAATSRPLGCTRYAQLRYLAGAAVPYTVEIGGTWLAASAQRTGVNREAKLLLLTHAFEHWRVARVELRTDARNQRSRTAIAALGAQLEGVLRRAQPSSAAGEDGRLRDSAVFSLLAAEWPASRERLSARTGA
jgi:RimJ/RimL family protein N-acetyltransferase